MTDTTSIFQDLKSFVAEPRFTNVALSPDGERLIASRTELNTKKNGYVTALWELPHRGSPAQPTRLTRGLEGESLAGFTADGDLLFTAKRETGDDEETQCLFLLPRAGGEARVVARRHSGVSGLSVAREQGRIALLSGVYPGSKDADADARIAKERAETQSSGILHTGFPVRAWDHDLGPDRVQVFVAESLDVNTPDAKFELRQLTSFPPHRRVMHALISPDGDTVYATVVRTISGTTTRAEVVAINVADGGVETIAADEDFNISLEAVSPTGTFLLVERSAPVTRDTSLAVELCTLELDTGTISAATDGFSDWPSDLEITDDGSIAFFTADHRGRGGVFRLDLASGSVDLLTEGRFHYASLALDREDGALVALRDAVDQPPLPVRVDAGTAVVTPLPCGLDAPHIPGTLTEFETEAADGTSVRSWLCLPDGASETNPAPLLLWIHGGPFGSWNAWSWRWNPWTAVARGYAVLLPDPAISTGYGQAMIDRGWDQLGGSPFDDIMRCTRDALDRPDIDETKKAALGGSYGGYMANWVAGHTGDFFDCVVTHASLWSLNQFRHTTDAASHWGAHLSDSHVAEYNPADHVSEIVTPMLVIHGDKDYRVPIGEGLRLWFELLSSVDQPPEKNPHRFLYFPDENHWVLSPNNSVTWYETVLAFVDRHVRGIEAPYPELLGS